jgi:hypothetical protein
LPGKNWSLGVSKRTHCRRCGEPIIGATKGARQFCDGCRVALKMVRHREAQQRYRDGTTVKGRREDRPMRRCDCGGIVKPGVEHLCQRLA